MKILIFGGTGAMGTHLVKILTSPDNELYVTSRSERKTAGVTYIKGNAHEYDFVNEIVHKYGRFNCIVDFMNYKTEEFQKNIDFLLSSTDQYVYLSSARVFSDIDSIIVENSPRLLDVTTDKDYLRTDEYALAKARQENILMSSAKRNWTIIRPYITYSEARLQLGIYEKEQWLSRAIRNKKIVFSYDIASHYTTLTYGLDVSTMISKIIGCKHSLGEAYNIAGNFTIKWSDVVDIYTTELEKYLKHKPVVCYTETAVASDFQKYQYKYDRLYDRKFDCKKILQVTGISEFTTLQEGIESCIREFFEKDVRCKKLSWKYEAMMDRAACEHEALHNIPGLKNKVIYMVYRYLPIKKF